MSFAWPTYWALSAHDIIANVATFCTCGTCEEDRQCTCEEDRQITSFQIVLRTDILKRHFHRRSTELNWDWISNNRKEKMNISPFFYDGTLATHSTTNSLECVLSHFCWVITRVIPCHCPGHPSVIWYVDSKDTFTVSFLEFKNGSFIFHFLNAFTERPRPSVHS